MTKQGERDLYAALGVAHDASADDLKRAYRKLARQYHPDVNPNDHAAEERFKEVSAAFEVLGDPEKRKLYDEFGAASLQAGFDAEQARAYHEYQQRPAGRSGFGGFEDLFGTHGGIDLGDLFRDGSSAVQDGADVETSVSVSLREAVLGGEREITFDRLTPCSACAGEGTRAAASQPCATCKGTGRIDVMRGGAAFRRTCATCRGSGRKPGPPCPHCAGRGVQPRQVRLKVKIPSGVETGQSVRLAGQGMPGRGGGLAGDLFLRIHVEPHPLLERAGRDLTLALPITVSEAMFGAKIEVPTLSGSVKLNIPPTSQSGTRLRLRGKGVPKSGNHPAGDFYVVLQVVVPEAQREPTVAKQAAASLDGLYERDVRADLRL